MMDWWLTIETDKGLRCWRLGDVDDVMRDDLIMRARTLADLPVGDRADLHGAQPHERLLARCTVGDRRELDAVDAAAVAAYRSRCEQAASSSRREAALAALMQCTSDERAQVIGGIEPSPTELVEGARHG